MFKIINKKNTHLFIKSIIWLLFITTIVFLFVFFKKNIYDTITFNSEEKNEETSKENSKEKTIEIDKNGLNEVLQNIEKEKKVNTERKKINNFYLSE